MSSHLFTTRTYTLPATHIREHPNATSPSTPQETPLYFAAKQYIPLSDPSQASITPSPSISSSPPPNPTPITILAAPALAIPPECYTPLFDALIQQSLLPSNPTYKILSIWIATPTHEGHSSVLNSSTLGDDSNYFDHSRDLLLLTSTHRALFPRPIIGLAHSRGCLQLINLSLLHPRLLSGLILLEPLIVERPPPGPHAALHATKRRDIWPSRAAAAEEWKKSRMYKAWHPAVLEQYITHGLRETPTEIYPSAPAGSVTLTTTKHQEAWAFTRPNFAPMSADPQMERLMSPDTNAEVGKYMSHRTEAFITLGNLPYVRPAVLYVFGAKSPFAPADEVERKMATTGTGLGGSGGREAGKVEKVILRGTGHNAPFESVEECAAAADGWLGRWVEGWSRDEQVLRGVGREKSEKGEGRRVSAAWKEMVEKGPRTLRQGAGEKVGREKL